MAEIFDPEDGGDMFFRNNSRLLTNYRELYPRRQKLLKKQNYLFTMETDMNEN
jgi:hypothetical protein